MTNTTNDDIMRQISNLGRANQFLFSSIIRMLIDDEVIKDRTARITINLLYNEVRNETPESKKLGRYELKVMLLGIMNELGWEGVIAES